LVALQELEDFGRISLTLPHSTADPHRLQPLTEPLPKSCLT
jgi:hypothetical protein